MLFLKNGKCLKTTEISASRTSQVSPALAPHSILFGSTPLHSPEHLSTDCFFYRFLGKMMSGISEFHTKSELIVVEVW